MKNTLNHNSLARYQSVTRKFVILDIGINILVGVTLLFVPDAYNSHLFDQQILPRWLYILIAAGFLLFALWQLLFFIYPGGFTPRNLRFAAFLSWIPVIALAIGLLSSLGSELLVLPKISLWLANIYMVLLGAHYWRLARDIENRQR